MSSSLKQLLLSTLPILLIFGASGLAWSYWQGEFEPGKDRYQTWRDLYVGDDPGWWSRWRPKSDAPAKQFSIRLPEVGTEAMAARNTRWRELADALASYQPDGFDDSLHHAQLSYWVARDLAGAPFQGHVFPLAPFGGEHLDLLDLLISYHPIRTQGDAKNYLRRLRAIPTLCRGWQARLDQQAQEGLLPSRLVLQAASEQLRQWTQLPALQHPLYLSFTMQASQADMIELNQYTLLDFLTQIEQAIAGELYPAFDRLAEQLDRLASQADTLPGIGRLPQGQAWYRHCLARYSAQDTLPASLLIQADAAVQQWETALGRYLDSLDRPHPAHPGQGLTDLLLVGQRQPDDQSVDELLTRLRAQLRDQRQYVRGLMDTVPPKRLAIWQTLPVTYASEASYRPATLDSGLVARLWLDPAALLAQGAAREPLLVHESLYPGRHLLWTRQLWAANGQRPDLRRTLAEPALLAGWSMYSSYLMDHDLVAYVNQPALRVAYLHQQLGRAVAMRLDLGMHHQGWSLPLAQSYVQDHLSLSPSATERLLLRVASQPGEAVASVTGFEALLSLRQDAQAQLGPAFFLQSFHDALLFQGALPLPLLRRALTRWAAQQQIPQ
jgi:uncharacterized protein (DUF885 family)